MFSGQTACLAHESLSAWLLAYYPRCNHLYIITECMFDCMVSLARDQSCREYWRLWMTAKMIQTACTCNRRQKHSLDSGGDKRHADDHQVQDVKVVPAKGAFMQEGPVRCHLWGSEHGFPQLRITSLVKVPCHPLTCLALCSQVLAFSAKPFLWTTLRMISMVKSPVKTWSA